MQQTAESTKPYLYYEQIINGLVSVPKRIQTYLGDAILVRNEQQRIEKEKEEQERRKQTLAIENEPASSSSANDGGFFKLPLFGWFNRKESATAEQKSVSEEKTPMSENGEESSDPKSLPSDGEEPSEQKSLPSDGEEEPSEQKSLPSDGEESIESENREDDKSVAQDLETSSPQKPCKIRNWSKLE